MVTFNQLCRIKRKKKKFKTGVPAFEGSPLKRGVCVKVTTTSPKKPNSAVRKIARVRLSNNKIITVSIPGQGHNLQEFSVVLVRGGRIKDVPGVKYKLIRGKLDFSSAERIIRKKARSKFGLPKKK